MLNGDDQYLGYLLEVNLIVSFIVCITKYPQKPLYWIEYIGFDSMLLLVKH